MDTKLAVIQVQTKDMLPRIGYAKTDIMMKKTHS